MKLAHGQTRRHLSRGKTVCRWDQRRLRHIVLPKLRNSQLPTVDAFARYTAKVEATDAYDAARKAENDETAYRWRFQNVDEYDARFFTTLDANGLPIEETRRGDF